MSKPQGTGHPSTPSPAAGLRTLRRSARFRRGLAAAAIVLAAGGLILFREPHGGQLASISSAIASPSGVNAVTFAGPGARGVLSLSHTKVLADARQHLFAELRLTADRVDTARERAPISLVVVLDTSGSMAGDKIDEAKDSVVKLIRQMDDRDEIAVVQYASDAEVVQARGRVSDVRESAIARVRALEAGGGTAIPRGLALGLSELDGVRSNRVRRVVLVSDGLDSTRAQAERIASDNFERGITISSLGIGLDFDESYMAGVARAGHGNFGFVKDSPALATFLKQELEETTSTVVENATVRVKLPRGVTFDRASGADARLLSSGELELKLGALFAGDERRVLVELDADLAPGALAAFETQAAWDKVGAAHAQLDVAPLSIVATLDPAEVERGRDANVLASAASVTSSRRQMEAAEAFARGDVSTAERLVDDNLKDLAFAARQAPAPAAASLRAQMDSYDSAKKEFRTHSAGSLGAKALPKAMMQSESKNLVRKSF